MSVTGVAAHFARHGLIGVRTWMWCARGGTDLLRSGVLRRYWPLVPLLVLCLPSYGGCNPFGLLGGGDDGPDPCAMDPAGCGEGEEFQLDPSCTLDGELVVEVGEGTDGFDPLGPGQLPAVHYGTQGGTHMWVGVRVANHARDYPQLEITVQSLWANGACDPECDWSVNNERVLVVDEPELEYTADGGAQVGGITLFGSESTGAIRATVRDPCGRQGTVLQEG